MENFLIYLLKANIALAGFYIVYHIFLRNDTFFSLNRFYLLGSVVLSFVLPAVQIPISEIFSNEKIYEFSLNNILITAGAGDQSQGLGTINFIFISYLIISGAFILRFVINITKLYILFRINPSQNSDGSRIVYLNNDVPPFSFLKTIFLNPNNLTDEEKAKILAHEYIHIRQLHTIDLIALEIIMLMNWFNPFLWLIKSSLKATHEYIADRGAIQKTQDKIEYQKLLLKEAFGGYRFDFVNNFNFSLFKRRITMMTKNVSSRAARLKLFYVLPVAVVLLITFSFTGTRDFQSIAAGPKKEAAKPSTDANFIPVDDMPKCDLQGLSKLVKYPEKARKAGKEGKVMCRALIGKDGKVKKVNIEYSDDKIFDKAAKDAVKKAKFTPAKKNDKPVEAWVTLPINFKLH
jgi:TonB family protein